MVEWWVGRPISPVKHNISYTSTIQDRISYSFDVSGYCQGKSGQVAGLRYSSQQSQAPTRSTNMIRMIFKMVFISNNKMDNLQLTVHRKMRLDSKLLGLESINPAF